MGCGRRGHASVYRGGAPCGGGRGDYVHGAGGRGDAHRHHRVGRHGGAGGRDRPDRDGVRLFRQPGPGSAPAHTHVVISIKVQTVLDGKPRSLDGASDARGRGDAQRAPRDPVRRRTHPLPRLAGGNAGAGARSAPGVGTEGCSVDARRASPRGRGPARLRGRGAASGSAMG